MLINVSLKKGADQIANCVGNTQHTAHFLQISGNSILASLAPKSGPPGGGVVSPELVEISGSQKQNSGNKQGLGLRRRKLTQGFRVAQGSPPWGGVVSARISGNFLSFQQILGK